MDRKQKDDFYRLCGKLISSLKSCEQKSRADEEEVWGRICGSISRKEENFRVFRRIGRSVSVAAALILLLLFVGEYGLPGRDPDVESYAGMLPDSMGLNGQVALLLSDRQAVRFDNDSVEIEYKAEGKICVKQGSGPEADVDRRFGKPEKGLDRVVVPDGKYTRLTLADGSRMHVNAGSRVVYPRMFTGNYREIYVEGEVYLDVAPDKKHPFRVKTSQFMVEVLGTSFCVNAYRGEDRGEVVLVEGAVKLCDRHAHEVLLRPDQLVSVQEGQIGKIMHVNAKEYTAWKDGLLIVHAENLGRIFRRLGHYYNFPVRVADDVAGELLDGKLDLRLSFDELFRMISVIVPVGCEWKEGVCCIGRKGV